MQLSSILVYTVPDNVSALQAQISAIPYLEVHYQCHDSGRLVVIQEADNEEAAMAGLQGIKGLPKVMAAEMVYHYVDEGSTLPATTITGETAKWV